MRFLLAFALAFPLFTVSGCSGNSAEVPAMTGPGNDPPPEVTKNYMEESRKHGGPPKNVKAPKEEKKEGSK